MPLERIGNDVKSIEITNVEIKESKVIIEYILNDDDKEKIKISYFSYDECPLEVGKVSVEDFNKLIKEENKNIIKNYISDLLVKRPYSKAEVLTKTYDKFEHLEEEINEVVKELEEVKLLDDQDYVTIFLDHFNGAYYGKYYIINYFKEKAINDVYIDSLSFPIDLEKEKAHKYFEIIKNKYVSNNIIKQKKKISEQMLKRGFDLEIIDDVISTLEIDETKEKELLKKDYNKALQKYKKREDKDNLIISYLVNVGYKLGDVEDYINSLKNEENNK